MATPVTALTGSATRVGPLRAGWEGAGVMLERLQSGRAAAKLQAGVANKAPACLYLGVEKSSMLLTGVLVVPSGLTATASAVYAVSSSRPVKGPQVVVVG